MKTIAKIGLLLLLLLPIAGCQPITGDITDLMSPPKLTGEQQAIEKALENTIGKNKFTLKYPMEGDYRSPIILHNLDTDSAPEAIAFYCPIADKAGAHVMILKQIGGRWQKVDDISEEGNEVDRICFGDFDGNGYDDLAIGWTLYTKSGLGLGVYSLSGNKYTKVYRSDYFTDMTTLDMDGDGKTDILLLKLDPSAAQAADRDVASLVSFKNGRLTEISHVLMDATVSRYAGVYPTKVDGQPAVLVDGYKGAHSMITEILTWKNGQLSSPLYDSSSKTVTQTLREVPITCTDINGDGITEIPVPVELPGYENVSDYSSKMWLIRWSVYAGGQIKTQFQSVMNSSAGYYFEYPDSWGKNVTVDKSQGANDWSFKVWNASAQKMEDTLFDICAVTEDDWNSMKKGQGSYRLGEDNGIVYAAILGTKNAENAPYFLDVSGIRQNFRQIH